MCVLSIRRQRSPPQALPGTSDSEKSLKALTCEAPRLSACTAADVGRRMLVAGLLKHHAVEMGSVAVLSPYKSQVEQLRSAFSARCGPETLLNVDFATVDGFQVRPYSGACTQLSAHFKKTLVIEINQSPPCGISCTGRLPQQVSMWVYLAYPVSRYSSHLAFMILTPMALFYRGKKQTW